MILVAYGTHVCDSQESAVNFRNLSRACPSISAPAGAKRCCATVVCSLPTRLFAGTTASPSHSPSRSHKQTSQLAKSIRWKRSGTRSPRFFPWDTEQRRQVWQRQVNNSLPATLCSAVQFSETVYLDPTRDETLILESDTHGQPCQTDAKFTPAALKFNCLRSYPCQKNAPGII